MALYRFLTSMENKLLSEFYLKNQIKSASVGMPDGVSQKYARTVPPEILELWRTGGRRSYVDDFFWVENPDDYKDSLDTIYSKSGDSIVIARDAFGDLFIWASDALRFINIRHGYAEVLGTDVGMFFNKLATDWPSFSGTLKADHYPEAKEKLGRLHPDECYGYLPILAAGGAEKIENLRKVKLKDHLSIVAQTTGQIG